MIKFADIKLDQAVKLNFVRTIWVERVPEKSSTQCIKHCIRETSKGPLMVPKELKGPDSNTHDADMAWGEVVRNPRLTNRVH